MKLQPIGTWTVLCGFSITRDSKLEEPFIFLFYIKFITESRFEINKLGIAEWSASSDCKGKSELLMYESVFRIPDTDVRCFKVTFSVLSSIRALIGQML